MRRILVMWGAFCLCAISSACTHQGYDGSRRYPLSGTITFDGRPIELGSITFVPQDESKRVSGGVIENGVFAVPEAKGANAGTYRIEIRWAKLTGRKIRSGDDIVEERAEGLPAKFHKESTLTADVPAPDNAYNFDLNP